MMVQHPFFLVPANDLSPLHFECFLLFTKPPTKSNYQLPEWPHLAPEGRMKCLAKCEYLLFPLRVPHPPLRPRGSLLKVGQHKIWHRPIC